MYSLVLFNNIDIIEPSLLKLKFQNIYELEGKYYPKEKNVKIFRASDLISYNEFYKYNILIKNFASKWYYKNKKDNSYYNNFGVSLGDCFRGYLACFTSRLIRHIRLLSIIKKNKENIIIWGNPPEYLKAYITENQIKVYSNTKCKSLIKTKNVNQSNNNFQKMIFKFGNNLNILCSTDIVMNKFFNYASQKLNATLYSSEFLKKYQYDPLYSKYIEKDLNIRLDGCINSNNFKNLLKVFNKYEKKEIINYIKEKFVYYSHQIIIKSMQFYEFIDKNKIDVLFSPMAWSGINRAFLQLAKKTKIPSYIFCDGILRKQNVLAIPSVKADYAFVTGNASKSWFQKAGIKSDKIYKIGNDLLFPGIKINNSNFKANKKNRFSILAMVSRPTNHGTEFSDFESEEQILNVCSALELFNDFKLYIRFHPRTSKLPGIEWKNYIIKKLSKIKIKMEIIDTNEELLTSIKRANIIITRPSATALQGMLLNKKVILTDFSGRTNKNFKSLEIIKTFEELIRKLTEISNGNYLDMNIQKFIKEHHSNNDDFIKIKKIIDKSNKKNVRNSNFIFKKFHNINEALIFGIFCKKNKKYNLAKKIFNFIIKNLKILNEEKFLAYFYKAEIDKNINTYKKALKVLRELKQNNDNLYRQGSILKKIGDHKNAKDIFDDILVNNPNEHLKTGLYFHLGEINLNNKTKAKKYFIKCLKYNPNHLRAKQYLSNFKK